jgi:hypothetical protein
LQKQMKSGQPGTKRWKYMYFEQMLFLIPHTPDCTTSSNYSPMTVSNGEEHTDERWEDERGSSGTSEIYMCRKKQRESNTSQKIVSSSCWTSWSRRVNTMMRIKLSCCPLYRDLKNLTTSRSTGQRLKCWALWGEQKIWRFNHSMCSVSPQQLLQHGHMIIISKPKHFNSVKYSK